MTGCRDAAVPETDVDWPVYGGRNSDRYSPLAQINRSNVVDLELAWRFDSGEPGESQTHPLVVDRTFFGYTPDLDVIALDAASGDLLWRFDAGIPTSGPHRGLAYWQDGTDGRLLVGVMNRLYAIDPMSGKPIATFGDNGSIDLRKDLPGDYTQHYVSLTTPGIVYGDLIIVGFRTSESEPAPAGDIRAYDVRSGALRWSFHTIPRPGEPGHETWPADAWWTAGGANVWAGFALDRERGIVYAPTGSAANDFYGGAREGDNLYANSLLALDASTGKLLWHFQAVRHDIWDRDFPSPPSLVTVERAGRRIDAVAQTTKQGYVYVFDRVTGEPLFPIEERAYPASDVPGERTAGTQPRPLMPEPFARQLLTEDVLTRRTPEAHAWALERFRLMRSAGQFVPFAVDSPTVIFPGFDGGAEWGGAAVDPTQAVLYVNSNDVAWTGQLTANVTPTGVAAALYQSACAACHGTQMQGAPPDFPALTDIEGRFDAATLAELIKTGRGRMPPFAALAAADVEALSAYLLTGADRPLLPQPAVAPGADAKTEMTAPLFGRPSAAPYRFMGYNKFLDPDGYPAVAPPWGTLNAIDLDTGEYVWRIPLGEYPELAAQGVTDTGSENYGGPLVTASGLLFIGATIFDRKIRALDAQTGELLWEAELPFAGTATPVTYMVNGKQYIAISTSNQRNRNTPQGSAYVAFALP
jgi:quinoprotein glucose dehydrogenase